jgi:putative transcriptional regulator
MMTISYNKLWKTLIDKKLKKKDLMAAASLNSSTVAKMGKDLPVSMEVMGRVCKVLECDIGDVMEILPDKE